LLPKIPTAATLEQLMGYEGAAAALYYRVLRSFLKTDLGFQRRQAHPPTDPVNVLLSLGYTLLYNHLYAAINIVGLDPYQGFFHQRKHGHAALASDQGKTSYRRAFELQVRQLARVLSEEQASYQPFHLQ